MRSYQLNNILFILTAYIYIHSSFRSFLFDNIFQSEFYALVKTLKKWGKKFMYLVLSRDMIQDECADSTSFASRHAPRNMCTCSYFCMRQLIYLFNCQTALYFHCSWVTILQFNMKRRKKNVTVTSAIYEVANQNV
jgi:hypothetical protein